MYLTYQEYKNMGGTLEETSFEMYEFQARAKIDWYTFNRLQKETEFPEAIKRCMYLIISYLLQANSISGVSSSDESGGAYTSNIASQSNDGVSISYNILSAKDAISNADAKIESVISQFLQGVTNSLGQKLLYRGVYPNE